MPASAGRFNKPVYLEEVTRTADDIGGHTESWATDVYPYWVSIDSISGRQTFEAAQRVHSATHRIEGRYRSGVSAATHRLRFGTRIFRIEQVLNPMERNETLEFVCEESPAVPEQQA